MRPFVRPQHHSSSPPAARPVTRRPGDERRNWIEALFATHLPRDAARRERAIAQLADDGEVWRLLHQARHSMAETTRTIEALAARALSDIEPLLAA
jgi:hypothetical protein